MGREADVLAALNTLRDTQTLFVCGAPGVGKTYFAAQIAKAIKHTGRYDDFFVVPCDSYSLNSREALLDALRRTLGCGRSTVNSVADIVQGAQNKRFLLVLDGLDQGLDPKHSCIRAGVTDLLWELVEHLTPYQRLVITSRFLPDEWDVTSRVHCWHLRAPSAKEALSLFWREYNECNSQKSVNNKSNSIALALVQKLGCHPLAVTLAARWLSDMDPDFARTGSRGCSLPELRNLTTLLDEDDKHSPKFFVDQALETLPAESLALTVFKALILLPSGATCHLLSRLAGVTTDEVEKAALQLSHKSLISIEHRTADETAQCQPCRAYSVHVELGSNCRMTVPAGVRSALEEKLVQNDFQQPGLERAVLEMLVHIAVDAAAGVKAGSPATIHFLLANLPNMHAAMDRALASGEADGLAQVTRLTYALHPLYAWHNITEGVTRLKKAEEAALKTQDYAGMARCIWAQGFILRRRRELVDAYACFHRAEAIFEQVDDSVGRFLCKKHMADVKRRMDQYKDALHLYREAELLFHCTVLSNVELAEIYKGIGDICRKTDSLDKALESFRRAREIFQNQQHSLGVASCLRSEAEVLRQQADYVGASECYSSAYELFNSLGATLGVARCIRGLGDLMWLQDYYPLALTCYEKASALYTQIGDRLGMARVSYGFGQVLRRSGQLEQALAYFNEAEAEYVGIGSRFGVAQSMRGKGDVYQKMGKYELSMAAYQQARKVAREIGSLQTEAEALRGIADVSYRRQRYDDAIHWYEEAGEVYQAIGSQLGYHHTRRGMGDTLYALGRSDEAREVLGLAWRFYLRVNNIRAASSCADVYERSLQAAGLVAEALEVRKQAVSMQKTIKQRIKNNIDLEGMTRLVPKWCS